MAACRWYSKLWGGLDKLTGRASVGSKGGTLSGKPVVLWDQSQRERRIRKGDGRGITSQ